MDPRPAFLLILLSACSGGREKAPERNAGSQTVQAGHGDPCLVPGTGETRIMIMDAAGVDGGWSAHIEGRCLTFKDSQHPQGVRMTARVNSGPDGGVWIGDLGGKRFMLAARGSMGCPDRKQFTSSAATVWLEVAGKRRIGCAEPPSFKSL